jgi:hypothetical protein
VQRRKTENFVLRGGFSLNNSGNKTIAHYQNTVSNTQQLRHLGGNNNDPFVFFASSAIS